jgi:prevent-host-death family protein
MQVTATEAKNRFGQICAQAKREPVFVEKGGRVDSVILSVEQFESLKASGQQKSMAQRKREFNEKYKDWIAEQNALVEKVGVFGEEFRPW